jgi:hypothetical protein
LIKAAKIFRLAPITSFFFLWDASISQEKAKNIANHDVLMVQALRRKGTKKTDTRLRVCLFVVLPQQFRTPSLIVIYFNQAT